MKGYRNCFVAIGVLVTLSLQLLTCPAQSTAFTYQGRLNDSGAPANGMYDLRFTIYDSTNQPGTEVAGPLTNSATVVSNGLFTAAPDFGAATFTGQDRWLEIAVRTNGAPNFTTLTGRQPITPTPYAIQALNASSVAASNITGSLPLAPNLALLNTNQTFSGSNIFSGTANFAHVGIGITDAPALLWVEGPAYGIGAIMGVQSSGDLAGAGIIGKSLLPGGVGIFGIDDGVGPQASIGVLGKSSAPNGIGVAGSAGDPNGFAGSFQGNVIVAGKLGVYQNPTNPAAVQVYGGIQAGWGSPGLTGNNAGYAFLSPADNDSGMYSLGDNQIEFFNNANEAVRITNGWVGIGTTSPQAPLDVSGNNAYPQLRISVPGSSPFGAFLSIDASATTGGKNYLIFSTGNGAGEGQGKLVFQNHSGPVEIMTLTPGGNVGIGTVSPQAKLQVIGNIQLGAGAGSNYATSSQEILRMVRGTINSDGTTNKGISFSVSHPTTGYYAVSFLPPFSDAPTVTATTSASQARVFSVSTSGAVILTVNTSGNPVDDLFHFIAVGPP